MPHSGGVRHSRPVGLAVGAAVGEPVAHVVEQQVGVRADRLVGERRDVGRRRSCSSGVWHDAQPSSSNSCSPATLSGRRTSRARRHGERARVEGHRARAWRRRARARRRRCAWCTRSAAAVQSCSGSSDDGDADVAVERAGGLLLDGRRRWPSSRSGRAASPRADVRARGSRGPRCRRRRRRRDRRAPTIVVVGDRLEQADPEHRRARCAARS